MKYDRVIIGAGIYGLYSALKCAQKGLKVCVIECEKEAFSRATYINQARVHMGYHYPRSMATALKSAGYFNRFNEDYGFCVHTKFDQIYATSKDFSWTDGKEFKKFCEAAKIKCEEVPVSQYFKPGVVDGAFLTEEYTYDAHILRDYFLDQLSQYSCVEIWYNSNILEVQKDCNDYSLVVQKETMRQEIESAFVINTTYASVNQLQQLFGYDYFKIKYELCEIALCEVGDKLRTVGLTVMDGPFFSIMPFGKTGLHSLTSVSFTPHVTCYDHLPHFSCQSNVDPTFCNENHLGNCNLCQAKPVSAQPYMENLAKKYILDEFEFKHVDSLYSMKPILIASELDDSRPTVIKIENEKPTFISALSGKINTVYDLDAYIL